MVTANQASIYLPFCQFDYILPLVVCSHILYVVVPIAATLHIISYDLIEAVSECQTLIRYFETKRNDISVYNTLYDEAVDLVEQFDVVSSKPRTTAGRQRNHANPQVTDTTGYRHQGILADYTLLPVRRSLAKRFKGPFGEK